MVCFSVETYPAASVRCHRDYDCSPTTDLIPYGDWGGVSPDADAASKFKKYTPGSSEDTEGLGARPEERTELRDVGRSDLGVVRLARSYGGEVGYERFPAEAIHQCELKRKKKL